MDNPLNNNLVYWRGPKLAVLGFINMLITTADIETDADWWAIRLWLVRN
jgi:hypothetical protein